MRRNKESLQSLYDTNERTNILIRGVPEGEDIQKGAEILFKEIMAKNFPNLRRHVEI